MSLPDETVLCPGHGLTTVGEKKAQSLLSEFRVDYISVIADESH